MSRPKVLVVGASIAGPTAAYWFVRAGFEVTVIERFPQLRTSGQNIDIRTSGVTVMRRMTGMEAAVRSKLVDMEGVSVVDNNGETVIKIEASGNTDQQGLVSEFEIYRGDLAAVLYDLTKDDVSYIFNEQVASMLDKDGGPITVEFLNGTPTQTFDLVVACDGATSRTRAIGLGCGVRDHIIPLNAWAAYFSISTDLLDGSKLCQGISVPGGRTFALAPAPDNTNKVLLMKVDESSKNDATLSFRQAQAQGTEATKNFVYERFAGCGWKTQKIVDDMMNSNDFYASEMVQVKVPSLSRGRFVLVGDAGYATGPTGGGTSLAMTGAYVLAGEIAASRGDIEAGLKGYEERMQPIIKDLQKIPPGLTTLMAPQTDWGIWWRNLMLKIVGWAKGFSGVFAWLGSFWASSFGGDKYCIPEYTWPLNR
jgi:2-polyprenyl-6-methoxyphenol hydroxylase-like FAD-dependent oxidoreductase